MTARCGSNRFHMTKYLPPGSCPCCKHISRGRDRPCERPPHRSVREDYLIRLLPRVHVTASRSLGYGCSINRVRLSLLAACRTRHNPCDSHPRLCVRYECACGAFPLVDLLPSWVGRASRFSPMEFPHMPRVSDSAVSKDRSRLSLPFMLPSPYQDTVGTPKW
jgi:hypothetical protein